MEIVQLIALYTSEIIVPERTDVFAEGCSMLHMNVSLIHDSQPASMLMGALDKDIEHVSIIIQELR